MKNENNIDKAFREKLENFGKHPPENIWVGIEGGLATGKTKKAFAFYLRIAAGILVLLGIGSVLYFYLPSGNNKNLIGLNSEEKNEIALKDQENNTMQPEKDMDFQHIQKENKIQEDNNVQHGESELSKDNGISNKQENKYEQFSGLELKDNNPASGTSILENKQVFTSNVDLMDIRSKKGFSEMPVQIPIPFTQDKIVERSSNKSITWDMLLADQEVFPLSQKESGPRLSVSAVMAPLYSYRDISKTDAQKTGYFNDSEKGKINYSGGLQFGIKAGSRLSFQTGLVYSRLGIGVENIFAYAQNLDFASATPGKYDEKKTFMVSNSIGTIAQKENNANLISSNKESRDQLYAAPTAGGKDLMYSASNMPVSVNESLDQYFHVLELPLMLKYKIIDRDVDFNLLGGFSTNFLLASESFINSGDETTYLGPTENIRNLNYSGNIGFGMDYNFINSFVFTVEPQLKYYLNSINEDSYISARPYSFGLYTGIKFVF